MFLKKNMLESSPLNKKNTSETWGGNGGWLLLMIGGRDSGITWNQHNTPYSNNIMPQRGRIIHASPSPELVLGMFWVIFGWCVFCSQKLKITKSQEVFLGFAAGNKNPQAKFKSSLIEQIPWTYRISLVGFTRQQYMATAGHAEISSKDSKWKIMKRNDISFKDVPFQIPNERFQR